MHHVLEKYEEETPLFPVGTPYCKRCGEYKEILIIHKNGDTYCMKCQNKIMRQKRLREKEEKSIIQLRKSLL